MSAPTAGARPVGPLRLVVRLLCIAGLALLATLLAPLITHLRRRWAQAIVRWWYGRILRVLNVRVRVHGDWPQTPALIVANHTTWLDILVLGHSRGAAFIAKAEIAHWWIIGPHARAMDTVFLQRGAFRTQTACTQINAALASHRSVVLFPQGTTGAELASSRFHARLFAPALAAQRPVLPVALRYHDADTPAGCHHPDVPWLEQSLRANFMAVLRLPSLQVDVTLCPLIKPTGHDRRSLAAASHAAIAAAVTGTNN